MMVDPGILAQAAFGFITGLIVGATHFASLRWNARLFVNGSAGGAVALQLGRIVLTVVLLALLVRLGLIALLSGALGFLAARPLLLRRFGAIS